MGLQRDRFPAAALLAIAAVLFLSLAGEGCRRQSTPPPLPPADQTYTTRGLIETLPQEPGGPLEVHHERIADFQDRHGEVVGMDPMIMPFVPAAGVDLSGLAPGDPVEFTWEMRWNARPNALIVKLTKLPAGTALELGSGDGTP
jgi:hypothetical protein